MKARVNLIKTGFVAFSPAIKYAYSTDKVQ